LCRRHFLGVGQIFQAHVFGAERDEDLVQLHVVIDILFALLSLDLIERRLRDVDFAGADQVGHLPEEEREQ